MCCYGLFLLAIVGIIIVRLNDEFMPLPFAMAGLMLLFLVLTTSHGIYAYKAHLSPEAYAVDRILGRR